MTTFLAQLSLCRKFSNNPNYNYARKVTKAHTQNVGHEWVWGVGKEVNLKVYWEFHGILLRSVEKGFHGLITLRNAGSNRVE